MSTPQRAIGTKATLNGKPVYWSGDDHGWQSSGSHLKLKAAGKFKEPNVLDRIGGLINGYLQPLGSSQPRHQRNKRAEAALRANERSKANPKNTSVDKYGTITRRMSAGGMTPQGYSYPEKFPDTDLDYNIHGLNFNRETKSLATMYDARTDSRPEANKVRRANVGYQLGDFLDAMQPDDVLETSVYSGDGKGRGRAGLYSKQTNGAVAPQLDLDGTWDESSLMTQRADKTTWRSGNSDDTVQFNPKDLQKPLQNLAAGSIVRRLVTHPAAQAALTADEVIGGITGTRPSKAIADAHIRAMSAYFVGTGVRPDALHGFHRGQLRF